MKDSLLASHTELAPTRGDGLGQLECPVCSRIVIENDIVSYYLAGTEQCIQLCDSCSDDAQTDLELTLDSDTITAEHYARLLEWCKENTADKESIRSDDAVAAFFGGYVWQSGGGISLVLIEDPKGQLTVLSGDCACRYASRAEFEDGQEPIETLSFRT